jgi:hypothetical protein
MRACFARAFSASAAFFSAASRARNSTIHAGAVLGACWGEYTVMNKVLPQLRGAGNW